MHHCLLKCVHKLLLPSSTEYEIKCFYHSINPLVLLFYAHTCPIKLPLNSGKQQNLRFQKHIKLQLSAVTISQHQTQKGLGIHHRHWGLLLIHIPVLCSHRTAAVSQCLHRLRWFAAPPMDGRPFGAADCRLHRRSWRHEKHRLLCCPHGCSNCICSMIKLRQLLWPPEL